MVAAITKTYHCFIYLLILFSTLLVGYVSFLISNYVFIDKMTSLFYFDL